MLYDVLAVELDSREILWVEPNKTEANAEAIITMAVMRQGVEDRFFTSAPAGKYKIGDAYDGSDAA